jgi:hypothetical protein
MLEINNFKKTHKDCEVFFCGDFNSIPDSIVVKYILNKQKPDEINCKPNNVSYFREH